MHVSPMDLVHKGANYWFIKTANVRFSVGKNKAYKVLCY